ncbi:MAG: hypothetical protein ABSE42_15215 [Bryobacteraceae bacterium]|jgi:hypothetical protein
MSLGDKTLSNALDAMGRALGVLIRWAEALVQVLVSMADRRSQAAWQAVGAQPLKRRPQNTHAFGGNILSRRPLEPWRGLALRALHATKEVAWMSYHTRGQSQDCQITGRIVSA